MKAKEIYSNSIKSVKEQILKLHEEIHELRIVKNNMYSVLSKMSYELEQINVTMDYINKIQFDMTKQGSINFKSNGESLLKDLTTKEIYVKYINISNLILTKVHKYEVYSNIVKIDYISYMYIIDALGEGTAKGILLGDKFVFHKTLGSIVITRFPRTSGKPVVDWERSNNRKRELIANGIKPKSNNDDGTPWIIFREDDNYLGFNWDRAGINVKNGVYYSFKPTHFINTPNRLNTDIGKYCKTVTSTLNFNKIGNIQKMLHLAEIEPNINAIYSNGL